MRQEGDRKSGNYAPGGERTTVIFTNSSEENWWIFLIIDFGHDGASFAVFLNSKSWQKHFAVFGACFFPEKSFAYCDSANISNCFAEG